jgi:hypothetical protein
MDDAMTFPGLPVLTELRGRFIHLTRRHVYVEDHAKTDDAMVRAVYKRFRQEPGLHKSREQLPRDSAKHFDQRERYREIMRRHVRAEDIGRDDDNFVDAVYARYAHERGVPLIDPNE